MGAPALHDFVYFMKMIAFGINASENEVEKTAAALASVLGLPFKPHESSFRGGDYYRAEAAHGTVFLQSNRDDDAKGGEPFAEDWPLDRLILCFDGADDEAWNPNIEKLLTLTDFHPTRLCNSRG
jgi:hypothetical protein